MLPTRGLTVLMVLLGYRQVSAPLVKLQKTLKESLEQPWLGSIQYSPAEGDEKKTIRFSIIHLLKRSDPHINNMKTRWRKPVLTVFEVRLTEVQVLASAGWAFLGSQREAHGLNLLS